MKYYIGIDLGGTNIVAGVLDENYHILAKAAGKTMSQRESFEITHSMASLAQEAMQRAGICVEQVESIGIGSPGMVDTVKREVVYAGNLRFRNTPLAQMVEEELHRPTYLLNDADAAAYGEFKAGAGRGARSMVAITLGTGVGSGVILDSKLYTGYGFAAGEFGHTVIQVNGRQCPCGRRGCVETYCSATGLIRTTKEHMLQNRDSLMWKLAGGDLEKVDGHIAFDAMRQQDPEGTAVVEEYTSYLGEAIVNLTNIFQPELICIGGGISKEGENLLAPIRRYLDRYAFQRFANQQTHLHIAQLGNDAGVVGSGAFGGVAAAQ